MRLLIQYSGEENQEIKLSVMPDVPKSTFYRILDYGISIFPNYVKNHTIIKTRNSIIITKNSVEENQFEKISVQEVKVKKTKKQITKPIDNTAIIEEIINHLNKCAGKNYKPNSKIAISNINSRLKEGYEFDDFIKVIEIKTIKWKGSQMEDYLTPNTLFGNKFESYLNEKLATEKTKQEKNYEQVSKATELGWNN
jgi:uncharacterized phage protein (TIGR02220 family)